ncbi:MAG: XRE family transcriptional regulator, partial [Coriobacteriales bacterium]
MRPVHYYNERVPRIFDEWPADALAEYARLLELVAECGRGSRAAAVRRPPYGMFELVPRTAAGFPVGALYCFSQDPVSGIEEVLVLCGFAGAAPGVFDEALRRMRVRDLPFSGYRPIVHDHDAFLERARSLAGFSEAYAALEEEYLIARVFVGARMRAGLTQEDVARAMGTTGSAISRMEN